MWTLDCDVQYDDYDAPALCLQGKIVLINAPMGAGAAWKVAQLLIPPRTAEKISICTSKCGP